MALNEALFFLMDKKFDGEQLLYQISKLISSRIFELQLKNIKFEHVRAPGGCTRGGDEKLSTACSLDHPQHILGIKPFVTIVFPRLSFLGYKN